ncbi:MAG: M15 family metallopeptidase [Oscillospiraceae bacterium]|nr:M15 family metallopeptidase [Oscillospiraceae bacterium]
MKKLICLLLAACLLFAMAACGGNDAEPDKTPDEGKEEIRDWTRSGYFQDENGNILTVTWMDDVVDPGWYVGCMLGEDLIEDSWGGVLPQEGNALRGVLPTSGSKGDITVTVSEDGEDGLSLAVEGGETYHFKKMDIPAATISVTINVEGWGNIDYAVGETAPEIDTEWPYQSAQINLDKPTTHTFTAWPDAGSYFVKWTKNGEDFSTEPTITVMLDESADFVAVFEDDPNYVNPVMSEVGQYQCERAHALVEDMGREDALITIEWGSSAWETARWSIYGTFDEATRTVSYEYCSKSIVVYDEKGEIKSEETEYDDGTGTVVFSGDGTFTWHDDKSETGKDMVFERVKGVSDIDYLALVNKINALPDGWEDSLRTVMITNSVGDIVEVETSAYAAYTRLKADLAWNDNIYLELDSARRTIEEQQDIMDRFIEKYGADYAAKTVAQPGYSEHHTGLALDLYFTIQNEYGEFVDVYYNEDMEKEEYKDIWDTIHSKLSDYGFILRYLEGEEHITGYRYEPWHIRYVDSVEIAKEIMSKPGYTLEEYLAGREAPVPEIDLGSSKLYSEDELYDAMLAVKCSFAAWPGCELTSLRYAGDEANSEENLKWLNSLNENAGYTEVCEFLMDFYSGTEMPALNPDSNYTDYQWWLARTSDGDWEIVSWCY